MKELMLFILILVFFSCKNIEERRKSTTNIAKDTVEKKMKIDSLGNPVFAYQNSNETIKIDTFKLKNNYKLIIFPRRLKGKDSLYYRLIGTKTDTILLKLEVESRKNMPYYYDNLDFENYMFFQYTQGTSHNYFLIYNKQTGKPILNNNNGHFILKSFDLKYELIIYDDEQDNYKKYIYDVNKNDKVQINPNDFKIKEGCASWYNSWDDLKIKRATYNYYFLGGFDSCNPNAEFKLKKRNYRLLKRGN
jgi:hypothetical protein